MKHFLQVNRYTATYSCFSIQAIIVDSYAFLTKNFSSELENYGFVCNNTANHASIHSLNSSELNLVFFLSEFGLSIPLYSNQNRQNVFLQKSKLKQTIDQKHSVYFISRVIFTNQMVGIFRIFRLDKDSSIMLQTS